MSLSRELIVAAKARADAATEGPWDAEVGEDIEVNALSARTQWNGNVGTPARSWRTTDRILSVDDAEYELEEADYEQRVNDAEFIAAARADVPVMADALLRVLDIHPMVFRHTGKRPTGAENLSGFEQYDCGHCKSPWPCATVRAVTGEDSNHD